ncbi:MAG: response regulator [Anaerolineae bacterium]
MAERRVLIVDDEIEWQEELRHILVGGGYQVDTAGSLEVAFAYLNNRLYHLVIIDIRLADRDVDNVEGMRILEELHARYDDTTLSKIMISAYGTREQMRKAFKQHKVADFISKQEFDKCEFLTIVEDTFIQNVRVNPKLDIVLEDGLSFENMIVGIISRDGKRVKSADADVPRLVMELEDLFCRLFYDDMRIIVRRVTLGRGKAGVVKVAPFSHDGHDETVIVKYGDHEEIARECQNYEDCVKGKIGMLSTNVLNLKRTPLLGGVVYSLIGTRVEEIVDFAEFYHKHPTDRIKTVLDHLFKETCGNWYTDRGKVQYCHLDDMYEKALDFRHSQLIDALEDNFPHYLDQKILAFRDLPDVHVPNPAYAVKGSAFSQLTFACTTHGDLNANNILIDVNDHTWLIDFYRTGASHILRDCIQLETVIKFVLLPGVLQSGEELTARYHLERALLNMNRLKEADTLHYEAPHEEYAKAFEVCRRLRQIARDLVHPNDDFAEYAIGLLYCSMNTQRFYKLPKINRLHALLAAGMLCQKLGINA